MSATGADQIEYMTKAGMPLTTRHRLTYTEVDPPRRLAYRGVVDFIPGVEQYQVETLIELHEVAEGVRMTLTFDAMHDNQWTRLAVMGHEGELRRLEHVLASRS